jgi:hypothetical protein
MANNYFSTIVDTKIEIFVNSFVKIAKKLYIDDNTGTLRHSGEYGIYREHSCIDLLQMFVPANLGISDGFVTTKDGNISTQCDIIIYDKNKMPKISIDNHKIFLAEAVIGVIEVKSALNATQLKDSLVKLSKLKSYKSSQPHTVKHAPFLDMFTAIIFHKYDSALDNIVKYLDECVYDRDINPKNKHNLILSIKDGLVGYDHSNVKEKYIDLKKLLNEPNQVIVQPYDKERALEDIGDVESLEWNFSKYPIAWNVALSSTFDRVVEDNKHIKAFLNHLHQLAIHTSSAHPDFAEYLGINI